MTPEENLVIIVSIFVFLMALLWMYYRFQTYRRKAMRRYENGREKALEEGVEVPASIAKDIDEGRGPEP